VITGATARRQQVLARLLLAVGLIAVAIIWVRLFLRPSGDLLNHQEFGRRFLAGTFLYDGGLNYPYLPAWAMAHAPLALVPPRLVSAVVFPIGVASLLALLWMLDRLSRPALPLDGHKTMLVGAAAVALSSRFVIRDLVDGGENLILTAIAWGALYASRRQWPWASASLLGTAIGLKLTAGVFLLVLLARRAYAPAVRAALAAAAFVALPALWMGIDRYVAHVELWTMKVTSGLLWSDATFGVLGPEPIGNVALRPAVGRWVAALAYDDLRDLSAALAITLIAALALVVIVVSARRAESDLDDAVVWASAGVLALLASPITWRAHLVAILPACYLLFRRWAVDGRLFAAGLAGLIAVAVPGIVLARGVTGETVSQWSDGWSITTLALAVLLAGICAWPARR
jgi:alpha-1,2-mannosyltransferase